MDQIFKIMLNLHIVAGTLGLLAGSFVVFAKKGDKQHQRIGKIFSYSMLTVGFSSFILASIHRNDFLFAVGVFTIFLAGTGWRYLYLRNIPEGQKPIWIDWALMVFMIIFGLFFIGFGAQLLWNKAYFGIILILFGARGTSMAVSDYKTYKGQITIKNYWLINHLQRMSGAYIASLTAFVVVNAPNRAGFLPWLLPTVIVVPFIVKWTRKYRINK